MLVTVDLISCTLKELSGNEPSKRDCIDVGIFAAADAAFVVEIVAISGTFVPRRIVLRKTETDRD